MKILLIDACARANSRTRELAKEVLTHLEGEVTRLALYESDLPLIDEAAVNARGVDCRANTFTDPIYDLAKQFAGADIIVITAPFWDLSFPAILKKYIEAITVSGITFRYSEEGIPIGLCQAKKLFYVTTSGGPIFNEEFGFGYVRTMAQGMYGISECRCFKAEGLDIIGADQAAIMQKAKEAVTAYFQ